MGHYTENINDQVTSAGCGGSHYFSGVNNYYYVVCNYGYEQTTLTTPYKSGPSC